MAIVSIPVYANGSAAVNPVVGNGAVAIDTATGTMKIGDGSTAFGSLAALNGTPARATAPATAGATGTTGQIAFDATHIYVCIATNTWVRATLATW